MLRGSMELHSDLYAPLTLGPATRSISIAAWRTATFEPATSLAPCWRFAQARESSNWRRRQEEVAADCDTAPRRRNVFLYLKLLFQLLCVGMATTTDLPRSSNRKGRNSVRGAVPDHRLRVRSDALDRRADLGGRLVGRGEAAASIISATTNSACWRRSRRLRADIETGLTRDELQTLLPAGGARNALDCALWELEARLSGTPVWQLAGVPGPKPRITTFTLPADDPSVIATKVQRLALPRRSS